MQFDHLHQLTEVNSLEDVHHVTVNEQNQKEKKIIIHVCRTKCQIRLLFMMFTNIKSPVLAAFITASVVFSNKLLKTRNRTKKMPIN